jgi:probable rRNA maturation factor
MSLDVEIQLESTASNLPNEDQFRRWAEAALQDRGRDAELVIRIVDEEESAELNSHYRGKQGPTNVLSFPFDAPEEVPVNLLGDLVICAPVILREAKEQGKSAEAHWAHMVVHGMLHLQGYDHLTDAEAEEMESLETVIITGLGFPAPYEEA